jgi:hypothetical protein
MVMKNETVERVPKEFSANFMKLLMFQSAFCTSNGSRVVCLYPLADVSFCNKECDSDRRILYAPE